MMMFDHFTNQEHDSVAEFLSGWTKEPWDDANVPIYLWLEETEDGERLADVVVWHPRKDHKKHVTIKILNDTELQMFRDTFKGIGERIFEQAAYNLEAFANGGMPEREGNEYEWGGLVLYYWERKKFFKPE